MKKLSTYHPRGVQIDGFMARNHPNYSSWTSMKARLKPTSKHYASYGGRGIDMDPRWLYFANFCSDLGIRPNLDFTLERVGNDLGYWPWNCKWATRTEQCLNRRVFKNSLTGCTGVTQSKNGRFHVLYTSHKKMHRPSGSFATLGEAIDFRKKLVTLVDSNGDTSIFLKKKVRFTSKTQIRGVSRGTKGGYIARGGHGNPRVYLGYFKTVDGAANAVAMYEKK